MSAAAISFEALTDLGQRVGIPHGLAPLLPVSIDAAAVVATCAWVLPNALGRVRNYARALVLITVALSVAGNGFDHVLSRVTVPAAWWVGLAVAVSAVPPLVLAATAHLAALLLTPAETSATTPAEASDEETEVSAEPALAEVNAPAEVADVAAEPRPALTEAPVSQPSTEPSAVSLRSVPEAEETSAAPASSGPDEVADLLPAMRDAVDELGDLLNRDRLVAALRESGHAVGGTRKKLIYAAAKDYRATKEEVAA